MVSNVDMLQTTTTASTVTAPMPPSSPIFHLPAELTQHILSFLELPSLESFRYTCHSFLTLVPPRLLRHAEIAYRFALYEKENKHAREAEAEAQTFRCEMSTPWCIPQISDPSYGNLHKNPMTRVDHLHCFTCYSYLNRDLFSTRQRTGRRSYGHSGAMSRFCITCGFRYRKWSQATYFRRGGTLPCYKCWRIAPTDGDAQRLAICSECFKDCQQDLVEREGQSESGLSEEVEGVDGLAAAGETAKDISADEVCTQDSPSRQMTGSSSRNTTICPQSGQDWMAIPSQTAISRRAERCVRCWMVDHTYQPALSFDRSVDLLCESCWVEKGKS
jgi:hypothetical protein